MAAKLAVQYDRQADILYLTTRPSYPEQETEELGDDIVARLNRRLMKSRASRSCSSRSECKAIPQNCLSRPIPVVPVNGHGERRAKRVRSSVRLERLLVTTEQLLYPEADITRDLPQESW